MLSGRRACTAQSPCRRGGEQCANCEAKVALTETDWYLIGFYRLVQDQYINQTPMGGDPPVLTPNVAEYERALRLHGYARDHWPWLIEWAKTMHRLARKLEQVSWYEETGKEWHEITPDDVR